MATSGATPGTAQWAGPREQESLPGALPSVHGVRGSGNNKSRVGGPGKRPG